MGISSNRLFHFTDKIENLLNILENNFIPHFSLEKIHNGALEIGIPMVSFCDIPLSQIEKHMKIYGNYAIGLSKEWGIENKLNPVFYYNPNSLVDKWMESSFSQILRNGYTRGGVTKEELLIIKGYLTYSYFSKPYKGSNWNKEKGEFKRTKRILYNEREWRYVPEESSDEYINFIFKDVYLNKESFQKQNQRLLKRKLFFNPDNVKYLIVKNETEIISLIKKIEEIKSHFNNNQRRILSSRIITVDQIRNDF